MAEMVPRPIPFVVDEDGRSEWRRFCDGETMWMRLERGWREMSRRRNLTSGR